MAISIRKTSFGANMMINNGILGGVLLIAMEDDPVGSPMMQCTEKIDRLY